MTYFSFDGVAEPKKNARKVATKNEQKLLDIHRSAAASGCLIWAQVAGVWVAEAEAEAATGVVVGAAGAPRGAVRGHGTSGVPAINLACYLL